MSACGGVAGRDVRAKGKTWRVCADEDRGGAWFASWVGGVQGCVEGLHMSKRLTLA